MVNAAVTVATLVRPTAVIRMTLVSSKLGMSFRQRHISRDEAWRSDTETEWVESTH